MNMSNQHMFLIITIINAANMFKLIHTGNIKCQNSCFVQFSNSAISLETEATTRFLVPDTIFSTWSPSQSI